MIVDEGFHLRRGLPAWERWGHPLDTLVVVACFALALRAPAAPAGVVLYVLAAVLACLVVTKDEWVHARHCGGTEAWLHACLFLLHPVILGIAGAWAFGGLVGGASAWGHGSGHEEFGVFLAVQTALTALFGVWQATYWNGPWGRMRPVLARVGGTFGMTRTQPAKPRTDVAGESPERASARGDRAIIDNGFYDGLGDGWHDAWDHPVALLRAEGALKNPWVAERIRSLSPTRPARVLDLGCGAGFLISALAAEGHRAIGLDASLGSLKAARKNRGSSGGPAADPRAVPAAYLCGDAYRLPFPDAAFDAVCAMDFLEHVSAPAQVIAEMARVLRPGGLFFFHTFNRNLLTWLIVIKGVELFVRGTPRGMHVLPLFIKPAELASMCARAGLNVQAMQGMGPALGAPFWRLLATRRVPRDFRFRFTRSLALGYIGSAIKSAT
ncbi:MAG: 3-demethylubiquinone-9 3-O-methyltransferase [Fibrobacteres bacterium]|nr:3-demethylubiquinone-9 3-O-methyltransferase [Fibrobacterota bacterium]